MKDPKRDPRMAPALAGVPLIGGQKFTMICPRGCVDELPAPFCLAVPMPNGQAQQIALCRLCFLDWLGWNFAVQRATPEQVEELRRARELAEQKNGGDDAPAA